MEATADDAPKEKPLSRGDAVTVGERVGRTRGPLAGAQPRPS
jgi:hypothetical protein